MKKFMYVLIVIVVILLIWTIGSFFFNNSVASPKYSVLEEKQGYEIRLYEPYITAQVEVGGTYNEAINEGFRILADYIFGNNTKQADIAMTAPVTEGESEKMAMTAPVLVSENEKLAMTAPVIESTRDETRIISFVMPFEYTLETLPKPNNKEVKIVPQEARKVAVLRFSWSRSSERVARKKQELLTLLERDEITPKNSPEYAGYNAPLTAPWLNRNEVIVEIE
jgi:hypothetical protein